MHVVSDGGTRPYRVHFRDPSFTNLQADRRDVRGRQIADVIAARRLASTPSWVGWTADMALTDSTRRAQLELRARSSRATRSRARRCCRCCTWCRPRRATSRPTASSSCAELLGLTTAEVAAVATFYTMYKRRPVGDYHVGVCTNTLCAVMGGDADLRRAQGAPRRRHTTRRTDDGKVTLEHIECNAACDYAPVVMVNWEFFDNQTPESAKQLVDDLRAGQPVDRGRRRRSARSRGCSPASDGSPTRASTRPVTSPGWSATSGDRAGDEVAGRPGKPSATLRRPCEPASSHDAPATRQADRDDAHRRHPARRTEACS